MGFRGGPKAYSWTDPRGGKVLKCDFKSPGIEYAQSKNELNVSPPMEFGKVKWNDSLRNITCLSKMGLDDVHLIIFCSTI